MAYKKQIFTGNGKLRINKYTMIASWLPLLAQLDISLGKFERPKSPNPKGNGPQICSEIIGSAFSPEKGKIKNRLQLKATSCASSI